MLGRAAIQVSLLLAGVLVLCGDLRCGNVQQGAAPQKSESAPSGTVPAEALKLGAQLEAAAPADFLKWARAYAKQEILDRRKPPEDEAVQKTVDERYPKAEAAARAAGVYLLWYLAYRQAARAEQVELGSIQDMERDLRRMEDDLLRMRNAPVPLQQLDAAREAEDRATARLEIATRQRDLHKRNLDVLSARANLWLKRLAALYEQVKETNPALLNQMK